MPEPLRPRPPRPPKPVPANRPWRVQFSDVVYDNGAFSWIGHYRTERGARFSAWWTCSIRSYGGSAVLLAPGEEPVTDDAV